MSPRTAPPSNKAKRKGAPRRRISVFALAVGAVVALFALAVVLTRPSDDRAGPNNSTREVAPIEVSGDALPPLPEGGNDAAIGEQDPEVRGESFNGSKVTITDDGQPKLILFLAHWCPHCQREVPLISEWIAEEGMPPGVELYSTATSTDQTGPNYPPSEWLGREDWPLPVVLDDEAGSAADAFGLTAFPYFVFIDSGGDVATRLSGEIPIEQLDSMLSQLH